MTCLFTTLFAFNSSQNTEQKKIKKKKIKTLTETCNFDSSFVILINSRLPVF